MMRKSMAIVALLLFFLVSCSTVPTIRLSRITKPADLTGDEVDTFYIRSSNIVINKTGTITKADSKEVDDLSISSASTEFTKVKFGIHRNDSYGVTTNLNITKLPNTDLIKEAGVEVIDKRVDTIKTIGSIATTLLPIFLAMEETPGQRREDIKGPLDPSKLPVQITVLECLEKNHVTRDAADVDVGYGVTIHFGAVPPDARGVDELGNNVSMTGLIYSACRPVTVKFTYKDQNYVKDLKVCDPRFYETVGFPSKGKITFHDECGVSVSSDKDTGISSSADLVNALATQGKAIKDAIDAAKKNTNTGTSQQKRGTTGTSN